MFSDSVEDLVKRELGVSKLMPHSTGTGGCISAGRGYWAGDRAIFVKLNTEPKAELMFTGEYESLKSLSQTSTVRVPQPIKVLKSPDGGAILIMEFLNLGNLQKHSTDLGKQLAKLHQHNSTLKAASEKSQQSIHSKDETIQLDGQPEASSSLSYVSQFGFHVPTCCGYLSQDNTWMDSWPDFYTRRIDLNVRFAEEKYGDREVGKLWSALHPLVPKMFTDMTIEPALLHGDLWGGNAAECSEDGAVVFDPASFYGHAEFDLSISSMFGGFDSKFFKAYHSILPKQAGFEDRRDLYQLFHYLNHWNHFGGGYKNSTLSILRSLVKRFR